MNRRQLAQLVLGLPLYATLAPKEAQAKPFFSSNDIRKDVLHTAILQNDERALTCHETYGLDGRKWGLLQSRAHTRKGRAEVSHVFEIVSRNRLDHLHNGYQGGDREDVRRSLLESHLKDARYYYAFRQYLSQNDYPRPNLRLETSTITSLKSRGLMASHAEMQSAVNVFEMTWDAAQYFGWERVSTEIFLDRTRRYPTLLQLHPQGSP